MPTKRDASAPTSPASVRGSAVIASDTIKISASCQAASSRRRLREPTIAPSLNLWRSSAAESHKALVALYDECTSCVKLFHAHLDIPAKLKEAVAI